MNTITRKEFLRTSLLAGGTAVVSGARLAGAPAAARTGSPNGDIRIAVVGFNGKGLTHIKAFSEMKGVRVAALCDVDNDVLNGQVNLFKKRGESVAAYRDYRKLLEDPSIDAVAIATPNHWHSLMAVWACQAGKDVYVEKPLSHNVWEGRKVIEAATKYGRIVQAGTQSRSDEALKEAFAYIHEGTLGKIQWVRGFCYKERESIGRAAGPQRVPSSIDYDLWTGPASFVPPRRNSSSKRGGIVHYDWHWFWNYGGGDIANQGIHEMDMCRWVLRQAGLPPSVMSIGGRFGYIDDAETPNTQIAVFNYEPAPLIFEVRGLPRKTGERAMDAYRGIRVGLVVQCENGYFAGGANGGIVYDNSNKKVKQFSGPGGGEHQANFVAAVRSRRPADLHAPAAECHVSSSLCHLANISYRLGQDTANDTLRDAIASHGQTQESFARMVDHLKANNVEIGKTPTTLGPLLPVALGSETFVTQEKFDTGFWANTMLRRDYRPGFVVPDKV